MKALSVKQPWACLLVEGVKKIEVRSWSTNYRGNLLICASASPKNCFWHDSVDDVKRLLHAGCMIGVVNLVDVRRMSDSDAELSLCDYDPDAYAWAVEPVSYVRPDKIIGKLNLFDVQDDLINTIANDESDWLFNYPPPQGDIKYTKKCDLWA
jgi:hypothetical protein